MAEILGNPNCSNQLPNGYRSDRTTPFSGSSFSSSLPAFTQWTWEEQHNLELALAAVPPDTPNRWQIIVSQFPGKSAAEVFNYYNAMLLNVAMQLQLPDYAVAPPQQLPATEEMLTSEHGDAAEKKKRRKPWTEKEHKLFIKGLKKYGKGDWRNISSYMVSRTPTQVASHAQKFYLRQAKKQRSNRSSIHDITTVDDDDAEVALADQGHHSSRTIVTTAIPPLSPSLAPLPPSLSSLVPQQFESTSYSPNLGSLQNCLNFDYCPI